MESVVTKMYQNAEATRRRVRIDWNTCMVGMDFREFCNRIYLLLTHRDMIKYLKLGENTAETNLSVRKQ